MGNGWSEWPLIIFTVIGQCVVGGFAVVAVVLVRDRLTPEVRMRLIRRLFFLWLLMAVGFVASILHLGSPLRAVNSLNRLGASALSNEIAAGSLFFALGGFWWLLAVLNKMPRRLAKGWLILTMLAGCGFVYAMCRVYAIATVPTWNSGWTPLNFVLTVIIGGPLLGYLLLHSAQVTGWGTLILPSIGAAALLASFAVVILQVADLHTLHGSVQQATALIPRYGQLQVWRLALLVLGLGLWIVPLLRHKTPSTLWLSVGLALIFTGEIIGRALFYGLHMTVGLV